MSLGAIVVCGGRSSRMGRPKAWLPFGPERMLQRVVRLVGTVAAPIVVVAAPGQDLPELPSAVRVVRDAVEGRGPLQGLSAGLEAIGEDVTFAYATATDVPFLKPAWIGRLAALIGDDDLAIPEAEGFLQPLSALYRRSTVLPAVRALLDADRLRPAFLREAVRSRVVGVDELLDVDPDLSTLKNLNTPEDYRLALQLAGYREQDGAD
jgi:molybdopterin-guanine dinucleotide biosynthesis protein A